MHSGNYEMVLNLSCYQKTRDVLKGSWILHYCWFETSDRLP